MQWFVKWSRSSGRPSTASNPIRHRLIPRPTTTQPTNTPVIRPAPFWPADAKQQQQAQEQWALLGSDGGDSSEGEGLLAAVYDQLDALRTTEVGTVQLM